MPGPGSLLLRMVILLAVIRAHDLDAAGHFEKAAADADADAFAQGLFAADLVVEKIAGKEGDPVVVVAAVDQVINIVLDPGAGARGAQFVEQQQLDPGQALDQLAEYWRSPGWRRLRPISSPGPGRSSRCRPLRLFFSLISWLPMQHSRRVLPTPVAPWKSRPLLTAG